MSPVQLRFLVLGALLCPIAVTINNTATSNTTDEITNESATITYSDFWPSTLWDTSPDPGSEATSSSPAKSADAPTDAPSVTSVTAPHKLTSGTTVEPTPRPTPTPTVNNDPEIETAGGITALVSTTGPSHPPHKNKSNYTGYIIFGVLIIIIIAVALYFYLHRKSEEYVLGDEHQGTRTGYAEMPLTAVVTEAAEPKDSALEMKTFSTNETQEDPKEVGDDSGKTEPLLSKNSTETLASTELLPQTDSEQKDLADQTATNTPVEKAKTGTTHASETQRTVDM